MNKRLLGCFTLAVVCLIADRLPAQNRGRQDWRFEAVDYGWMLDYEKARRLARRLAKPLMVVFRCIP